MADKHDPVEDIADAGSPEDIPLPSWRAIVRRLWIAQSETGLWVMASGVAFYAVLAILPGLGVIMLSFSVFGGAETVKGHFRQLEGVLPQEALNAFVDQLTDMLGTTGGTLRWGVTGSLVLVLWSVWLGMRALIAALNLAYHEKECRGVLSLNAVALVLGLGGLMFVPLTFSVFLETPTLVATFGLSQQNAWFLQLARWPFLVMMILTALALLYRIGPCRAAPKWRWVSWGAVAAALLWIAASAIFTGYARHVANYQSAYGLAGAVITLMLWLNLVSYAVLLGGALNAEMERQTTQETASAVRTPSH
jgi:membrane protein